jgi:MOSC domain-containing protein YiiM
LQLGARVQLRVTTATSRCRMVTLAQPGLAAEQAVLQHLVAEAGGNFGVYAEVVAAGELRCGDEVRLVAQPGQPH